MATLVIRRLRGAVPATAALLLGALLAALAACRSAPPTPVRAGWQERGVASWYGEPFHGRRTASGEIYDMHALTAAHPTLPFGTVIAVRNLDNGQRVEVVVTDRGPFAGGRILDLSYGAALALDMARAGLARVEVTVLVAGDGVRRPAAVLAGAPAATVRYSIQVAAFLEPQHAEELARELRRRYPEVRVEESSPWFRVRVGRFSDRRRAERLRLRLEAEGHAAILVPGP
jgi:rare lipoprotein A